MPIFDPKPRPPRFTRLDRMVYGLGILLVWIAALMEFFAG